jgi:hypothetical protein
LNGGDELATGYSKSKLHILHHALWLNRVSFCTMEVQVGLEHPFRVPRFEGTFVGFKIENEVSRGWAWVPHGVDVH